MPTIPLPLLSANEPPASSQRLVNCYIEQQPTGADQPVRLVRSPGIRRWSSPDVNFLLGREVSGLHKVNDWLFVASDALSTPNVISAVDRNGLWQSNVLSLIPASGHPVSMADNGSSLILVSEPYAQYVAVNPPGSPLAIDPATTYATQITDTDFTARGAAQVIFLDNFLLYREPRTGRFFGADLGSPSSFDALNFATAEAYPDKLVGMIADHGQAISLGDDSVEIWENAGVQGFPFQRIPNGRVEIGCKAGFSVAQVDQSVVWLASDGTYRKLSGVTPQRISTHQIERHLEGDKSDARGYSYTHDGHVCYVAALPDQTFVCDFNTQLWHERKSYGYDTWQAKFHCQAFGRTLVAYKGYIGYLDSTCYDEIGDPLVMQWTYEPIDGQGRRVTHDRFELGLETGVGLLPSQQGDDPTVLLEYSDDGGVSFRPLPRRSLGARGERTTRVLWTGLGSSYRRVYRCTVSDPVKVVVTETLITTR